MRGPKMRVLHIWNTAGVGSIISRELNKIEDIEYDPDNKLVKRLLKHYNKMIAQDIEKYSDM